jgi:hypothetical protein
MGIEAPKSLVVPKDGTEAGAPEEEAPVSEAKSQRASELESLREDGRKSLTQMLAYRKKKQEENN